MIKPVYFVRHGQTFWNIENKICGATDIGLTEEGKGQARQTGLLIKQHIDSNLINIDEILTSPLSRARDTALIISEITGLNVKEEPRLIEQNFGRYESTPRDGKEFAEAKKEFLNSYDGGESMLRTGQRIYNLLDDIKNDDKIYLLVAHNGIARMVRSYFEDMTNEEFASYGVPNCSITEYRFKD